MSIPGHPLQRRLAYLWSAMVEPSDGVLGLLDRRRARVLATVLVCVVPIGVLSTALGAWLDPGHVGAFLFQMACHVVLVMAWALSRSQRHRLGLALAVVAGTAMSFGLVVLKSADPSFLAAPILLLLFSGLFGSGRLVLAVAVVNSLGYLLLHGLGRLPGAGEAHSLVALQAGAAFLVIVGTRHQHELERQRQIEMLLADRMVALGTLAAGVAHEVNNPLTYVVGNLDRLRTALEGSGAMNRAQLARRVATAQEGVARVEGIIRDLQTFSRHGEVPAEPIDLRDVVDSALKLGGNKIREAATLEVLYEDDVAPVMGEVALIGQVVLNLLVNAQQAVQDVRHPTISVRVGQTGEGGVFLDVEDNGCGIDPALRTQIFRPFFTTKPDGIGTGLGLSVCRNIIAGMDGLIDVASDPGCGTCFRLLFPPAGAAVARSHVEVVEAPLPPASLGPLPAQVQILVVDDEPIVTEIIAEVLDAHDVVCVHRGELALDILRERPVHLVLCDLMMPGFSGMELRETIVSEQAEYASRFVFMTGGAYTQESQE